MELRYAFTAMDPSGKRAFYYSSEGENELLGTVDTKNSKKPRFFRPTEAS